MKLTGSQTPEPGVGVGGGVIKEKLCSTQLSMKFQLHLKKTKMLKNIEISCFPTHSHVVFIMLINVKMPTIVGILTFMRMISCMIS